MTLQKTWKPTVAGILSLAVSAYYLYMFFALIFMMMDAGPFVYETSEFLAYLAILLIIGITVLVVTISGSIYALRRRKWRLAVAGSILGSFAYALGIPALILILMSRQEFE